MAATATDSQPNGIDHSKLPTSISRVYNVPVVKDSITYADHMLRSYSLSAVAYGKAEALATSVYKRAGEPLQDKLQPRIDQLDGLANKGLDFVQGKAPFIFDTQTGELVAQARKPADQALSTAKTYHSQAFSTAKGYQDLVSSRLHDTLVASQQSLGGLQTKLGAAAGHVPRSPEEAQQLAYNLYEQIEALKNAAIKQSHDLPAHVSKSLQPFIEKLQKGATEVKTELSKKDVPNHLKAQKIIGVTKEITTESLNEAIETLRMYVNKSGTGQEITENGDHAVESSEQFVEEHTPGDHSYAEAVKAS
ncbi:MAG: hypothetical protein CYPHOPRED_002658 [Cyphobasidiales sp. Tagirdzhanova-0007]|nr:MAG: hypothetical protein CYPHOPRED_002658 [Cyphobasidiales sp. Tagirdzhanova-0007]